MKNKKWKRVLAACLCVSSLFGGVMGFSSCGGKGGGEVIDATKTQVKIKYNNGGLGRVWLDTVLAKFEEVYADVSFEEGKTGVQVLKDFAKRNIELSAMKSSDSQVFLLEDLDMWDFGVNGALMDITDLVQSPAKIDYTTSEDVTIESKLQQSHKNLYNVPTKDHPEGGYYAIPFFDTPVNLNYNVDLFEERGLYLKRDGYFVDENGVETAEAFPEYGATADGFTEEDFATDIKIMNLFVNDKSEPRSYGPNGKTGVINGIDYSVDDGLPATYADFRALLTQMEYVGVTAFVWNDLEPAYLTSLINGVWANNIGWDQVQISLTFSGVANNIADLDADGQVQYNEDGSIKVLEEPVTITPDNVELIHRQKGKLDALKFAQMIVGKDSAGEYRFNEKSLSQNHKEAQNMFIDYENAGQDKPIAFLIEGEWWLREAYDANFNTIDEMHSKRFGILPLPRATRAEVGLPITNVSDHYSAAFINSNCPANKIKVAKELFSFLQNESSLLTFSYYTNMIRPMTYELSDENLAEKGYFSTDPKYASSGREFGYFTKNIYATRIADPTSTLTTWQPYSSETRTKATLLAYRKWAFSANIGGEVMFNPLMTFYAHDNLTPEDYFEGICSYWDNVLK